VIPKRGGGKDLQCRAARKGSHILGNKSSKEGKEKEGGSGKGYVLTEMGGGKRL